jgi:hypothetical protein
MKIDRKELLQATKFLLPGIGDNEARKNLMHLNVEEKNGKCIMTAADGYIIKRVVLYIDAFEPNPDESGKSFLIPKLPLSKFKAQLNKEKTEQFAEITKEYLDIAGNGARFPESDYQYPDFNNHFGLKYSDIPDFKRAVAFNSELMIKLLTGFPDEPKNIKGSAIKLTAGTVYNSENHAFRFQTQDQKYTAIIMPVKIDW